MVRKIRVELLQTTAASVQVDGREMNMSGLGRALVFLVFLRGAKVDRSTLARSLWPGEDESVVANRLRVTLTRLRSLLGQSLDVDRKSVGLSGIDVYCDLWEEELRLREALDEIDPREQLIQLISYPTRLCSRAWKEVGSLCVDGTLTDWDESCRSSLIRASELAASQKDWDCICSIWEWMRERGDLLRAVCERHLDAHFARGTLDDGIGRFKRAAKDKQLDQNSELVRSIMLYSQELQARSAGGSKFETGHIHALGGALLARVDRCAEELAAIITVPEVQLSLQSVPQVFLSILEEVSLNTQVGAGSWVRVQCAKIGAYASLYDYERVIETFQSVVSFEMSPEQETIAWMHYSFSQFQLRRWEEAFSTIARAQVCAENAGDQARLDICKLTEGSYLWHVGEFESARTIYERYLSKYADSEDFTVGVNRATCYANYAIIELVFGELEKARYYAELAYEERSKFDLSRHLPILFALLSVIRARTGDLRMAIEIAVESLKLTFQRGSSREGQINMEWICGVMVVAGQQEEAWQIMTWVNNWRKQARHERSVCENHFAASLQLQEFNEHAAIFSDSHTLRNVMRFQIKCLRTIPLPGEE